MQRQRQSSTLSSLKNSKELTVVRFDGSSHKGLDTNHASTKICAQDLLSWSARRVSHNYLSKKDTYSSTKDTHKRRLSHLKIFICLLPLISILNLFLLIHLRNKNSFLFFSFITKQIVIRTCKNPEKFF